MPSGGPYGSLQSVHQGQAEAFENYSCVQNNSSAAKTSENIGLLIVASLFKHTNTFEWSIVNAKPKYKCKFV